MATKKTTKKSVSRKAASTTDTEPPGENLEMVRDLLFGSQMRSAEARMARLEERIQRDLDQLRNTSSKDLAELDKAFRKETQDLAKKIKAEQDKRADELHNVGNEISALAASLEARVAEAEAKGDEYNAEVRAEIAEHARAVAKDLNTLAQNVAKDLSREVTELRAEKTDTAALVDLFSEMALRLSEHLRASTGE